MPTQLLGQISVAAAAVLAMDLLNGRPATASHSLELVGLRFWPLAAVIGITLAGVAAGIVLLVIPALILIVFWLYAPITVVTEGRSVRAAFVRSNELSRGAFWWTLGSYLAIQLTVALAAGVVSAILAAPFVSLDGSAGIIMEGVVTLLVLTIAQPVALLGVGLMYLDRRVRREGALAHPRRAAPALVPGHEDGGGGVRRHVDGRVPDAHAHAAVGRGGEHRHRGVRHQPGTGEGTAAARGPGRSPAPRWPVRPAGRCDSASPGTATTWPVTVGMGSPWGSRSGCPSRSAIRASSSSERWCSSTSASRWASSRGTPTRSTRNVSRSRWCRSTSSAAAPAGGREAELPAAQLVHVTEPVEPAEHVARRRGGHRQRVRDTGRRHGPGVGGTLGEAVRGLQVVLDRRTRSLGHVVRPRPRGTRNRTALRPRRRCTRSSRWSRQLTEPPSHLRDTLEGHNKRVGESSSWLSRSKRSPTSEATRTRTGWAGRVELARMDLFHGLPETDLALLENRLPLVRWPKGAETPDPLTRPDHLSWCVRAASRCSSRRPTEPTSCTSILEEGSVYSTLGTDRQPVVAALEDSAVSPLSRACHRGPDRPLPQAGTQPGHVLSERLASLRETVALVSEMRVEDRLRARLHQLADRFGRRDAQGCAAAAGAHPRAVGEPGGRLP